MISIKNIKLNYFLCLVKIPFDLVEWFEEISNIETQVIEHFFPILLILIHDAVAESGDA